MNWLVGVCKHKGKCAIFAGEKLPHYLFSRWDGVETPIRAHVGVDRDGVVEALDDTAMDAMIGYAYDIGIPWEEIEYALEYYDENYWVLWKFAPGPEGDFHIVDYGGGENG